MNYLLSVTNPPVIKLMAESWNSSVFFLLLSLTTLAVLPSAYAVVTAVYIFGDSTADVGTNNHFNDTNLIAKADFPPNGIDFRGGKPTGRFSNGYNSVDFLCQWMGLRMSPKPYLDLIHNSTFLPTKHVIKGVNFASAGSGILDESGKWLGRNVHFSQQIQQFAAVRQKLDSLMGREETDNFLSKSLSFLSFGANDIFTYYLFNDTERKPFINRVIITYERRLRTLYSIGVRKFGIISVPPLGCCPSQRATNDRGECVDDVNEYCRLFYSALEPMLENLSSELKEMKYSLGDSYKMVTNLHDNPLSLKDLKSACCGTGNLHGKERCYENAEVCKNRDEYLFWDWYHPTEIAYKMAAQTLYNGSTVFVKPINFKQLAEA